MQMIKSMGAVAIGVVIVLLIMSVYSIAIMVERYLTYTAAKKQSREFAPRVAQALKNDRIEEAINISDKHRKSHLAMVVSSGLQEFRAHEGASDISGDEIEASKRALQRAIAIKTAEFKRGLSGLATIGSTAPFVGLFGTVFGIINAFSAMGDAGQAGIGAVASGISKRYLPRRSACSWPFQRYGCSTTSPARSMGSLLKWTTRRLNWLTTLSRTARSN